MNPRRDLFLGSCLCFVLVMPAEAQDGQDQQESHDHIVRQHPLQDIPLHEKFHSTPNISHSFNTAFCFALGGAT